MNYPIIDRFRNFRNRLFNIFRYRADATMDLIDATAGGTSNEYIWMIVKNIPREKIIYGNSTVGTDTANKHFKK